MEKATMLSSLKWGSSVFTIIQVILWSLKVSSSFHFSIKPMIKTVTLQFTYMYARHACGTCHTPVQWQLLCSPGHLNRIIQFKFICPSAVFQNNFNFSILIPILSCSPDSLLMISMVPHFVAFYFMITELTGVGYSWRSLLNWLHCCPSCLSWKLWGTILAPNTRLLVYIFSQWGRVPLFLQHSNREICSLKLHMYIVQPLYPIFTMGVCFISHSSMNTLKFEMH